MLWCCIKIHDLSSSPLHRLVFADEPVEDCPSVEEFLAMEQAIGEPRYASFGEADRAMGYID
jgi:hypothetical protein